MDELLKALPSVRVPTAQSRVYKDECSYSYHNQARFIIFSISKGV